MTKLSIVIPFYNEEENIDYILKNIDKEYKNFSEFILVDNGSTDNTLKKIDDYINLNNTKKIIKIKIEKNIGYGNGINTGLKIANGDFLGWTHGDLQTDIKDIYKGFEMIENGKYNNYIFLKGIRKNRKMGESLLTLFMSFLTSLFFLRIFNDINAQPKIFHKTFYKKLKKIPNDFSLDLYFYYKAKKNNLQIIELPVIFNKRLYGIAKGGSGSNIFTKIKIIIRTLKYIIKLRINEIYST